MPQNKQKPETPASKKFLMAVAAILILLGMLYILNGDRFPSEISYDKLH